MASEAETDEGLLRELRFTSAAAVVVGVVIGVGIFVGANRVAQSVESVAALFAIWIGAGLLTLLGALTYAEFGALYPRSGGDYVYVQKSISPFFGFFVGWASFAINLPASTAALALAFASQMDALKPSAHAHFLTEGFSIRFTAVAVIALFTLINYLGVRQGGTTQRLLTFGKIALMFVLVGIGLFSAESDMGNFSPAFESVKSSTRPLAYGLVGALFAYDGWNAVSRIAGEIRNPQRVVPAALTFGVLGVIAIYVLVNAGYLAVLGLPGMAGAGLPSEEGRLVASRTAEVVLGYPGKLFVAAVIGVSALGTVNGLILSGPRIYFAMARDRLFFAAAARPHPVRRTPHIALLLQGGISAVLAAIFTYEQLQDYVVLAAWVAYALTSYGLIRHRRLHPELPRPYRVPFYPYVPIAFTLLAVAFIIFLFYDALAALLRPDDPTPKPLLYFLFNVAVLAGSVPVYRILRRRYGGPLPSASA